MKNSNVAKGSKVVVATVANKLNAQTLQQIAESTGQNYQELKNAFGQQAELAVIKLAAMFKAPKASKKAVKKAAAKMQEWNLLAPKDADPLATDCELSARGLPVRNGVTAPADDDGTCAKIWALASQMYNDDTLTSFRKFKQVACEKFAMDPKVSTLPRQYGTWEKFWFGDAV